MSIGSQLGALHLSAGEDTSHGTRFRPADHLGENVIFRPIKAYEFQSRYSPRGDLSPAVITDVVRFSADGSAITTRATVFVRVVVLPLVDRVRRFSAPIVAGVLANREYRLPIDGLPSDLQPRPVTAVGVDPLPDDLVPVAEDIVSELEWGYPLDPVAATSIIVQETRLYQGLSAEDVAAQPASPIPSIVTWSPVIRGASLTSTSWGPSLKLSVFR